MTDPVLCKACGLEANPADICDHCGDGPFCRYCFVLRHGDPCGKKSRIRRFLEFVGLARHQEPTYVTAETWRRHL